MSSCITKHWECTLCTHRGLHLSAHACSGYPSVVASYSYSSIVMDEGGEGSLHAIFVSKIFAAMVATQKCNMVLWFD